MNSLLHIVCPQCQSVNRVRVEQLGSAPKCGQCKNALFQGRPVTLDEAAFDLQVSRSEVPLLVDFWAPWCGPCRLMAPAFEQAAAQLEPRLRLAKVNTEESPRLSARLSLRSIPTLALFAGGREVARQPGALTRAADIVSWVRRQQKVAAEREDTQPYSRM